MTQKFSEYLLNLVSYVLQFYVTYDLYIAAFAGAGVTLLALVSIRFSGQV